MEVGITPIIMAESVMRFLIGSKLIHFDKNEEGPRAIVSRIHS